VDRVNAESECRELLEAAVHEADGGGEADQLAAWEACVAHPCARHVLPLDEVWTQIAELRRRSGGLEGAIDAWEHAIAAGYRSVPHPRANVAELLLTVGRRREADELYTALREQCPTDVWLRVAAAWAYARIDDHDTALHWLDEGIELALASGDPDDLLGQLRALREHSLEAAGRDMTDELSLKMDAFVRPSSLPRLLPGGYGEAVDDIDVCPHCGWEPPPVVEPTPLRSV
jgi:tetratricopeptide (TPR) repeat protein